MRTRGFRRFAVALAAWLATPALAAVPASFAIQPQGLFHGDEPVARDGEQWLALRVSNDRAELIPTRVSVATVHDPLLDEDGVDTGREVASSISDAVMLLRGTGLAAGVVPVARVDGPADWSDFVPRTIRFGDQAWRLTKHCVATGEIRESQRIADCTIQLAQGERRQTLVRMSGYKDAVMSDFVLGDDASPQLLFAGDLDRDGRLDLIFDTTDHYNVARPTLFLSSEAKDADFVGESVRFRSVGC